MKASKKTTQKKIKEETFKKITQKNEHYAFIFNNQPSFHHALTGFGDFLGFITCLMLLVHLEQRVFGHHHDGLLFEVAQQFVADILLVDHQAEHIFTEPACRHDETTLLTPTAAPRILDLPLQWIALSVEVDSGQRHGVGGAAVEGGDALGLRHIKRGVKQ